MLLERAGGLFERGLRTGMPLMPLKSARRDLRSAPNTVLLEDEFSAPIDELLTRILALAPIKLERAFV